MLFNEIVFVVMLNERNDKDVVLIHQAIYIVLQLFGCVYLSPGRC